MSSLKDSSFYQMILDEGRTEGRTEGRREGRMEGRLAQARAMVLRLGTAKFGPPEETVSAPLQSITELDRLERMLEHLLDATRWKDLLATE
jgi:predicted transposase YdaD